MAKEKMLLVSDGAIRPEFYEQYKDFEKYGVELKWLEDESIGTMTLCMDRMHACEVEGGKAAVTYPPLLDAIADVEYVVVHMTSINREVLEHAKKLKLVAVLRGGYENIDVEACTERGIKVVNASWRSAPAVADFTIGMMIAENKNIARAHKAIAEGGWRKTFTNQAYIRNMDRSTVGIIGFGYIGKMVLKRLSGFGCKILVHDPFLDPKVITDAGYTAVSLDELLEQSDFVSLHIRQSEKTYHYFGEEQFKKMKPTAYFINTARPFIVDTAALISALENKTIGGAAIDVFEQEPVEADSPFRKLDNVTLVSHMAGTSSDTNRCSVEIGYQNLSCWFEGKPMPDLRN